MRKEISAIDSNCSSELYTDYILASHWTNFIVRIFICLNNHKSVTA